MDVSYCVVKCSSGEYDYVVLQSDEEEEQTVRSMGLELIEICGTKDAALRSIDALTRM